MKLTDSIAEILKANGVGHVFGLQGGAVAHIFDSLELAGLGVTYTHHEESAALAAVAYAKATQNLGCVVVTTGPGATNAITGLLAAWQDSIPCLFISGQVRSQHTSYGRKVRQVGTQEVNICDVVRPLSKYVKFVTDKDQFPTEFAHALTVARSGRPGPVWIDLPLDFQWQDVAVPDAVLAPSVADKAEFDQAAAAKSIAMLREAKKPLLVLGYGVRLAGSGDALGRFIEQHRIPYVTTWTGADLFPTDEPLNLGVIGMSGQRGANHAVFQADLLLCLGTHLSIPHTTTLFDSYAPQAKKIMVNIDQDQLDNLNVAVDLKVLADLKDYLAVLAAADLPAQAWPDADKIKAMNWYVPPVGPRPNSNVYVRRLTQSAPAGTCLVVDGGGTALYAGFQAAVLKQGDRIICSSAISAMGTGLAETIGVAKSGAFSKLLCVIGDGSFLMNIQDLQTIRQDNINAVISVVNNNGYLAIRHTQKEFLGGRYFGTHPEWSLAMPSIEKLAHAFDIPYVKLDAASDLERVVSEVLKAEGPVICEVVVDEEQEVLFRQAYAANGDGTFSPQPLSSMRPELAD
ncbi:MAG: thiamine pyrophosphate-binding protein [Rhodocyclaceae bacterium]|nr:MAG: thiamine pyrophosphate-binding protein [Rhodocyclaceae bacterium]